MYKKSSQPVIKYAALVSAVIFAAIVTCAAVGAEGESKREKMQRSLSDRMLRVHVIANSDSREDQQLKLKVRDRVLEYFKESFPLGPDAAGAKNWARAHTKEIEEVCRETLKSEGSALLARVVVGQCYFGETLCGGILFPEGEYDALRVEIGKARGRNWWCVLYPWLCPGKTCRPVGTGGMAEAEEADILSFKKFKIKWYYRIRRKK